MRIVELPSSRACGMRILQKPSVPGGPVTLKIIAFSEWVPKWKFVIVELQIVVRV